MPVFVILWAVFVICSATVKRSVGRAAAAAVMKIYKRSIVPCIYHSSSIVLEVGAVVHSSLVMSVSQFSILNRDLERVPHFVPHFKSLCLTCLTLRHSIDRFAPDLVDWRRFSSTFVGLASVFMMLGGAFIVCSAAAD